MNPMPSTAPTLSSVTAAGNVITLHFSEAMQALGGSIVISDGHGQTYMTKDGLATRIVGAHDTRTVSVGDADHVSYSGNDVIITLSQPLGNGVTYSVTMAGSALQSAGSQTGFGGISSPDKFSFTATAYSAPTATIGAPIHFTDSGASSGDYVTSWDAQTVSGTYNGTLGSGDFVQVSLDNGASWHKASVNDNSWSYNGSLDWTNLGNGNQDSTFSSSILARVSNIHSVSSGTISQSYTYDHQVPSTPSSSNFTLSNDSGNSSGDHITNVASQIVSGTISGLSGNNLIVQISMNNGDTWDYATVSGDNWGAAVTLNQIGKVLVRVVDLAGNTSSSSSQYYDYTTGRSLSGRALTLATGSDSGTDSHDLLTKHASSVTLAVAGLTGLHTDDVIEIVDLSNGSAVVGHYHVTSSNLDAYGNLGTSLGKLHNGQGDLSSIDISLDQSLEDGTHQLAARVSDVAGNVGTALSSTLSITLDTAAPLIVSSTPTSSASTSITDLVMVFGEQMYISNGASVTLSNGNSAEDQVIGISSSDLSVNGTTLTIHLPVTLDASMHYTVAMNGTIGDAAGNYSVVGDNLLFDFTTATPPRIMAESTAAFSSGATSFSGVFYSEDSGNKVQVSFDGLNWHDATATHTTGNLYDWSYAGGTGTHTLQARMVDSGDAPLAYLDYGSSVLYFGSSDADTITVSAANAIVYSGDGADTVTVGNHAHVTSEGTNTTIIAGDDATVVTQGTQSGVTVGSNANVTLGAGGSTVQATGDGLTLTTDSSGSHSIVLSSLNVTSIATGGGNDTLNLEFSGQTFTLDSLHTTHQMTGIDIIVVDGAGNTINVGSETDVTGLNGGTLKIDGNASTDVLIDSSHWTMDVSPVGGFNIYHSIDNSSVTLLVGVNLDQTLGQAP